MPTDSLPARTRLHREIRKCRRFPLYFLHRYAHIFDATAGAWLPFHLWPMQADALRELDRHRLAIILKARQLGMTWLTVGYALWNMLFRPAATVLLFSKRDDEAVKMLNVMLKEMHARLPAFLQCAEGAMDSKHEWELANGSRAKAFPTTGGRSYTASLVIVDEADYIPNLNGLLGAVKPTIDAGGQLVLLSTSDKSKPESAFKKIYRAAKAGANRYRPLFYAWKERPGRTTEWYEEQRRDILSATGSADDLHERYPATDIEALSARTLDKRLPPQWLDQCFVERNGLIPLPDGAPSLPGLEVFAPPHSGGRYVLAADPAEGNPCSDDSAMEVIDLLTGEEMASLAGRFQPSVFAAYIDQLGRWYNNAPVLVERNNHGHAVLLWLAEHSRLVRLVGLDSREGWLTTSHSKAMMWSLTGDALREKATVLHSFATRMQLGSIEGGTLRAPVGEHDDRAVAFGLCCVAFMLGRLPRQNEETRTEGYCV